MRPTRSGRRPATPKVGEQRFDVGDAVGQPQETVRAGGQPHPDMVGGDDAAALGGEPQDQVAPEERP